MKHKVLGKPSTQTIQPTSIAGGSLVGNITLTATGAVTSGREPTTDERVEALERDLEQVREALSSQSHDLGGRIDSLRADMDSGV